MATTLGRTHFSLEFKMKVIEYYKKTGLVNNTIKKFQISKSTWYRWRNEYLLSDLSESNTGKHGRINWGKKYTDWMNPMFYSMSNSDLQHFVTTLQTQSEVRNWTNIQKYQYINKINKKISFLCKILNVGRTSYYDWLNKNKPPINAYKENIVNIIRDNYGEKDINLGVVRFKYTLRNKKLLDISIHTLRKYLRLMNKIAYSNGKHKIKSNKIRNNNNSKEDKINYDFSASKNNEKIYVDFTEINNGTKYHIGFVKDGYNNEIIGSIVAKEKNARTVKKLLQKAFKGKDCEGIILHHDHGAEFDNYVINNYLKNKKIINSYSKKGKPTSNAPLETLMSSFKRDSQIEKKMYKKSPQKIVDNYVEAYNTWIPQKRLGWVAPQQYK